VNRNAWLWIAAGAAGVLLFTRRRSSTSALILGSPIEAPGPPKTTPHGYFGAPRAGPPKHTHQGVDLAAPAGSHVLAIGDGEIIKTDPGLGKIVRKLRLDVPGSWGTSQRQVHAVVYADLGKPLVDPGDHVRRGDPIALVDKPGFVHFAVKELHGHQEVFFDPKDAGFTYRRSGLAVS
jgi:murein DD-endopeptidase MepM/ murein hydrolase activator NlpD